MDVPIYLVVGSTEEARCNSFSAGFFPLMGPESEFATKWVNLCAAQLSEGIHDPIKCYEYLGRFYVQEGNKRVSVLKSMGSAIVQADIIRLMPEQSDDITTQIYLEFLDRLTAMGSGEPWRHSSFQMADRVLRYSPSPMEERNCWAS